VYTDVGAVVAARALQGYNGTVFAYGQTGSGKTWTMMGGDSVDTRGVIPRLVDDVFGKLDALRASPGDDDDGDDGDGDAKQTAYMVTVSYLEIYNEVLRDLLNPRAGGHLDIREHPEHGIYVKGLAEMVVATGADVLRMLAQGSAVRRVAVSRRRSAVAAAAPTRSPPRPGHQHERHFVAVALGLHHEGGPEDHGNGRRRRRGQKARDDRHCKGQLGRPRRVGAAGACALHHPPPPPSSLARKRRAPRVSHPWFLLRRREPARRETGCRRVRPSTSPS
jgi:hypothetical protein